MFFHSQASENCGNEVVRLVSYIVIPSLPKGALVEWQFIAHHDAGQWKGEAVSLFVVL